MTDSSRELVGPDISATVTFEGYPRFIKGGFEDYEVLGIKRCTADSKHVPLSMIEVARKQRVLESRPESSRIFGRANAAPTVSCAALGVPPLATSLPRSMAHRGRHESPNNPLFTHTFVPTRRHPQPPISARHGCPPCPSRAGVSFW